MLDLHVPKIIAYLIERIVLFLYPSSFPIHSIQETSVLEGVIMKIYLACLIHFFACELSFVNLTVHAINNFHKQLYIKDS